MKHLAILAAMVATTLAFAPPLNDWPSSCTAYGSPLVNIKVLVCKNSGCYGDPQIGYQYVKWCTEQCLTGTTCPYQGWITGCGSETQDYGKCCRAGANPCTPNFCGEVCNLYDWIYG